MTASSPPGPAREELIEALAPLLSEPDVGAAITGLCRLARDLTGAASCFFVPADDVMVPAIIGWDGDFSVPPRPHQAPLLLAAQAAEDPVRVDDLTLFSPHPSAQVAYGSLSDGRLPRSWLGVPVRSRVGERFGALLVASGWVRAFDSDAERLAVGLAACLAAILSNQRLLREREAATHALAHTLLPPLLPHIPGLEVAARYRATGAGNLVGGDFYDVFPSVPGHWDVLLGDVSGFGPEAAALTGIARYTVRAVANESEGPAQVLEALNRAMVGRVPDERFCTAVNLRLHHHAGGAEVVVASGGHPPALVLRDDGRVERFEEPTGMLLGVADDPGLIEAPLHLDPGDAVVLYTDGVTEARDPAGRFFGIPALEDLLAASAGRTADGLARRVELAVVDHQGGRVSDDMAVVVLRVDPSA